MSSREKELRNEPRTVQQNQGPQDPEASRLDQVLGLGFVALTIAAAILLLLMGMGWIKL